MGVIHTISAIALTIISGILVAVTTKLLSSEIDAWTPRLVDWLIKRAVKRLPCDLQLRMEEEWRTFINDTPGKIVKLLRAFDLLRAAIDISREGTFLVDRAPTPGVRALHANNLTTGSPELGRPTLTVSSQPDEPY